MTTYLTDAMTRVIDQEQEVMPGTVAKPFPHYTQPDTPYWTNNITEFTPGFADDEYEYDIARRIFLLERRYIIGHITGGYQGQPQEKFWEDWITILDFLDAHPNLTSTTYPSPLQDLDPEECKLMPGPGLVRFQNTGIGNDQVGGVIREQLIFNKLITRK